jgi:hypothetical protein
MIYRMIYPALYEILPGSHRTVQIVQIQVGIVQIQVEVPTTSENFVTGSGNDDDARVSVRENVTTPQAKLYGNIFMLHLFPYITSASSYMAYVATSFF